MAELFIASMGVVWVLSTGHATPKTRSYDLNLQGRQASVHPQQHHARCTCRSWTHIFTVAVFFLWSALAFTIVNLNCWQKINSFWRNGPAGFHYICMMSADVGGGVIAKMEGIMIMRTLYTVYTVYNRNHIFFLTGEKVISKFEETISSDRIVCIGVFGCGWK